MIKTKRTAETKIMKIYRVSNNLYKKKIPLLPKILTKLIRIFFAAEIPCSCNLEQGVQLKHGGLGIVIHDRAQIGKNTIIYQHVTVGGREGLGIPVIGENVYIGTGACVMGNIKIGNNVKIGANAVVVKDVPANTTVLGIPAKAIQLKIDKK